MEQPDLKYLKTVIRSILTSSPSKVTISQILNEYPNYEGVKLPFKHLGFKTVYELLENMSDVLRIPPNPNMNSFITLIVDQKTSHLRELVVNQKTKKQRPKRHISTPRSSNNHMPKSANFKSRFNNSNNHRNDYTTPTRSEFNTPRNEYSTPTNVYSTPRSDTSARGYDHVKIKSFNSKPKGTVTTNLRSSIENLCNTSEIVSINTLKNFLINHPDYKKMGTSNIEESINMLKYFIYIDRGGIHLKDSPYEIFPSKTSDLRKYTMPTSASYLNSIVDENEELSYCEENYDYFDEINDSSYENLYKPENEYKINQKSISTAHQGNTNLPNGISPQYAESCQKLYTDDSLSELDGSNQSTAQNLVNMIKTAGLNDSVLTNNDDLVPTQNNVKNRLISSIVQQFTTKPFHHKIMSKIEREANSDVKNSKTQKDYYKSAIVAIIARSNEPITVNKVLAIFEKERGYSFPFQKFSCGTYMDFFRLYPDVFKLDNQCSTNSIVSIEKQIMLKPRKTTIRKNFIKASIFNNAAVANSENKFLNDSNFIAQLLSDESDDQKNKDPIIDNSCQAHSVKPVESYEMYDSDTILDTMKVKMRRILTKYKDGILCNDFMDIYGKEYNSYFNFSEYGFRSMRDMAYQLPSVFYVKVTDDDHECILFEADKRSELENNDPSLFYKNIPKTILCNLSNFFNKHQNGVKFNELMSLYCAEYGRAYEPLKYGYSSEKHMFECLDKMVEIENNELFTVDAFAYTTWLKNKDPIDNYANNSIALPDHDFLLHYSGKDICSGRFKYSKVKLHDEKCIKVIVAEIYNPSSFYIQLSAEVNNLNSFMDRLQVYYNENEEKYKVIPKLILPELACTSCFEDSNLWHRAIVLKIVDEENVKLLYVDYGSIEIVPKTNVRLLASQFGAYPTQAVHCGLYNFNELNYPREISESFAEITENHVLEAQFHPPTSEDDSQKMIVTLFLNTIHERININNKCSKEMISQLNKNQESVRRMIYRLMQE
uniref:Tudor domain-containing protein 1 n=2 Tax=Schizaphis graminum TaxID=13262 RepID=A0A2S2PA58_SCHGA